MVCQRHPCPHHHKHSGQYQETGQEQGRASKNSVPSACPTRGNTYGLFTANHGQLKPLLSGFVVTKSCSSQAHDDFLPYGSRSPTRVAMAHPQHGGSSTPPPCTHPAATSPTNPATTSAVRGEASLARFTESDPHRRTDKPRPGFLVGWGRDAKAQCR